MNSPTRQCKLCGKPAIVIERGDVALCSEHALKAYRAEHAIAKDHGTRGPFAKRASGWR
jgi:tRNA threonylcarbamoyladenosine modification (KEOPS) complex Cgi121 subunit